MIRSFRDAEAEKLFRDELSRPYRAFERTARCRLAALNAAVSLRDLAAIPGNHLEALRGGRDGQHSIRINAQYRICFTWGAEGPENVELVDYQ